MGGERLHGVAIQPDGTIIGVGDVVAAPRSTPGVGPKRPGAVVIAYRPDGKIDRSFGYDGRFRITPRRSGRFSGYTGFTEVEALPSGRLLVSGYIHQRYVLYRLTADGRIDRSFGGSAVLVAPMLYAYPCRHSSRIAMGSTRGRPRHAQQAAITQAVVRI